MPESLKTPRLWPERLQRCRKANDLIRVIGSCGRRFFVHKGRRAGFFLSPVGRVWFRDSYTRKAIFCHTRWLPRGFSNGGTLNALVRAIARWIHRGDQLSPYAFWSPRWACGGDTWGYGPDMEIVRDKALEIGLVDQDAFAVRLIDAMRYGWDDRDLEPVPDEELGCPVG
jgi:hypothetical protein